MRLAGGEASRRIHTDFTTSSVRPARMRRPETQPENVHGHHPTADHRNPCALRPPRPGRSSRPGEFHSGAAFSVKPYLQIGRRRRATHCCCSGIRPTRTPSGLSNIRPGRATPGRRPRNLTYRTVDLPGVEPHRVYRAALTGLAPGGMFAYRVQKGGEAVFSAEAHAPKSATPALPLRGLRRLRGGHARAETDRLPGVPGQARLRDDSWRHGLRARAHRRVSRPVLAGLQRRRALAVGRRAAGPVDALRGRAGEPRHRHPRPGEDEREPRLLLLLGSTAQRPARQGRGAIRAHPRLAGGLPDRADPGCRRCLSPDDEFLVRLRQRALDRD